MSRIAVVDLGTGNLHSVSKALERVAPGRVVEITRDPEVIRAAGHVVLPGQGAIGSWFHALDKGRLREVVTDVLTARPILGICLGLQALYAFSEEDGGTAGFGIMAGNVRRFPIRHEEQGQLLKVPHMGWNNVCQAVSHPLWRGIADDTRFYFVHSYYAHSATSPQKLPGRQRMDSRLFRLQRGRTSLRYNFIQRKAIAKALRSFRILFVGTEAFKSRTILP